MQVQSILFPLVVATEVYQWLDYESLVLVVRATRSVRQVYEPVALQMVKHLVKVAAGRVGSMRARLHHTSLVHSLVRNLWKLWRRSVGRMFGLSHHGPWGRLLHAGDGQRPSVATTR